MDFKVLPIAAICCAVMIGYNEDFIFNNKSQKEIVQNSNIDKNQKKSLDAEKENDKEKEIDKDLELKLKEKKQSYLEKLQDIKDEYERVYSKFKLGKETIESLREISVKSYEESQKVLNEIYEDLNKYISEDKMEKIKEEQVNWIAKKEEQEKNYKENSTDVILEEKMYFFIDERCKVLLNYLSNAKCEVKSKNIDVKNDENTKEDNEEDVASNQEDSSSENEMTIDEVISKLHDLLDREDIKTDYIFNEDNNYVKNNPNNPLNVEEYYIFRVSDYIEENDGASPDNNIIVNKQTLDVYSYGADGSMEKLGNLNN